MSQYIHIPFAAALLIAVGWTTVFSLTNKPGIRGFRNLGILASYILVLVFLFVAGEIFAAKIHETSPHQTTTAHHHHEQQQD